MDTEQLGALLLLFIFLVGYGVVSGAHSALFSLKDEDFERLKGSGDRRSRFLRNLLKSPRQTSISLLVIQRLLLFCCLLAGWGVWLSFWGAQHAIWVLVGLPPLVLIAANGLPQGMIRRNPLAHAYRIAIPLWFLQQAIFPARWAVVQTTRLLASMFHIRYPSRDEDLLEREYLGLVEVGRREGVVESDEHRLIRRVFEFGDRPVSMVMTPRPDMHTIPLDMDLNQVVHRVKEAGYSRIPVYRGDKDEIIGILYSKDLLRLRCPDGSPMPRSLEEILHEPYFVSTQMSTDKLLREFQRRKLHMAICVDEYGGVAGLVTMEDLLEELVGEIYDEFDLETRLWEAQGDGKYMVSGRMDIGEFEELLGRKLDERDCKTVAGLILKQFGRIPRRGESLDWEGIHLVVERVIGSRIQTVRVEPGREAGG